MSGAGEDTILNSGSKVKIDAGAGNDSIHNYASNVTIDAGAGNNRITNDGDNFVSIVSGAGNDDVYNQGSRATIETGAGDDYIYNNYDGSSVTIDAGTGNDTIENLGDEVIISAGGGADWIYNYLSDSVTVDGSGSADFIINGAYFTLGGISVSISGGEGSDTIASNGSNSTILGDTGDDLIRNGYYYYQKGDYFYGRDYYEYYLDENYNGSKTFIDGGDGNDSIYSQGHDITMNGGTGDDYIDNDSENVLFTYKAGDGNDTIYGFENNDTLQISGSYSTQASGYSDVLVQIGSGSILLKYANGNKLNIVTVSGGEDTLPPNVDTLPAGISISGAVLTASTAFTGNEIHLANYSGVTKVNASALSRGVTIVGNAAKNSIKGGKGADTISGGGGNDTVSLGGGADVYVYTSGNDLIQDYVTGEDKIKLASASLTSSSISGSNVVLKTSVGNLTVKNGKGKSITVIDSRGTETTKIYPETSSDTLPAGITVKSATLTAGTAFTGSKIDLADYESTVTKES